MSDAESELLTDNGRGADNDWITKLTPLLIVDLVSLSLLLRGWSFFYNIYNATFDHKKAVRSSPFHSF